MLTFSVGDMEGEEAHQESGGRQRKWNFHDFSHHP